MIHWKVLVTLGITFAISSSKVAAVKLFFYSPHLNDGREIQNAVPTDLALSTAQPIKVICHGLASSSSVSWYGPMISAYVQKGYNVIAVDWEEDAYDGYFNAIDAASGIGEFIANSLIELRTRVSFSLSDVHIIGHSLGAHIAGYIGKYVYALTNVKIGRITGLDPAGPLFNVVLSNQRLCSADADFVDVIHTNAGGLGTTVSLGDIDFYPDGGATQNSCIFGAVGCSHNIAPTYFVESINSNNFIAKECGTHLGYLLGLCKNKDQAVMGEGCSPGVSGDFYLTTNSGAPYGKG